MMQRTPPQTTTRKYPLGTLMIYGPTTERATKFVAAVFAEAEGEVEALERWSVMAGDIRYDPEIAAEIAEFFRFHGVREAVHGGQILGCPHEEGIDYPLGAVCPECPFWAETDRFTHGPKSPGPGAAPAGHITAEEIIAALSETRGCPPTAAFASADARREVLTEALLAAVDDAVENVDELLDEEAHLASHALYLLAKWREPRAAAAVLHWLALPGEGAFEIAGDVVTHAGSRILAAVCGGDRGDVRALVENRAANEYCRAQGLAALAVLVAWGELPRETLRDYLRELIGEKLERGPNFIWVQVACTIADLELAELAPLLRQPYDDAWVDPMAIDWEDIESPSRMLDGRSAFEHFREQHPPITDVAAETAWWSIYRRTAPEAPLKPRLAARKVGRNDLCPCGSGKKYKKCCGAER